MKILRLDVLICATDIIVYLLLYRQYSTYINVKKCLFINYFYDELEMIDLSHEQII